MKILFSRDRLDSELDDDEYTKQMMKKQLKSKGKLEEKEKEEKVEEQLDPLPDTDGLISNVFENYMNKYVELKDAMINQVVESAKNDDTVIEDDCTYVLSTYQVLLKTIRVYLIFIQNVIQECSTLSKGKVYFEIYQY